MKIFGVLCWIVMAYILWHVFLFIFALSYVFMPFSIVFWLLCLAIEFYFMMNYSHKKKVVALPALAEVVPCCIYAYFNGNVRGREEWAISDFAYYASMGDYDLYRLCTFFGDCAIAIIEVWAMTFLFFQVKRIAERMNTPQSEEPAQQEPLALEKEEETETTNELPSEEVELKKKWNVEWKFFRRRKKLKIGLLVLGTLLLANLLWPTSIQNPVEGCGKESYNPKSFWHPWGDHEHRGIDIFARKGTPVHPAIGGVVIMAGHSGGLGGNCVVVFSSGMRFHYYAHLDEVKTHIGAIVTQKSTIGTVGNTGNAAGKPSHLHYSISSFIPQGDWRFYPKWMICFINPIKELEK